MIAPNTLAGRVPAPVALHVFPYGVHSYVQQSASTTMCLSGGPSHAPEAPVRHTET